MRSLKRTAEDFEEIALDIFAARELLDHAADLYYRATFTDKVLAIGGKLDLLRSKVEEEMYKDWPEEAFAVEASGRARYDFKRGKQHVYCSYTRNLKERQVK